MQSPGPTTLITPPVLDSTDSAGVFSISPALIVGGVILLCCIYYAFVRRNRGKIDPRELAFRTLAQKQGLTRSQISLIRQHARSMGLGSPIGVLMCPQQTNHALQRH